MTERKTTSDETSELIETWRKSAAWAADRGHDRMAAAYCECADELEAGR